jgi:hypothetical protein
MRLPICRVCRADIVYLFGQQSYFLSACLFLLNGHRLPFSLPPPTLVTLTMKLTAINVLSVASLPVIVLAHARNPLPHRRQASAASSSASSASPASTSTPSAGTPVSGSSTFSTPIFPTPTYSPTFTVLSQNPTAVPLASIVVNAPPASTLPLPATAAVGSTPSNIPNAPGIPDSTYLNLFSQGQTKANLHFLLVFSFQVDTKQLPSSRLATTHGFP